MRTARQPEYITNNLWTKIGRKPVTNLSTGCNFNGSGVFGVNEVKQPGHNANYARAIKVWLRVGVVELELVELTTQIVKLGLTLAYFSRLGV